MLYKLFVALAFVLFAVPALAGSGSCGSQCKAMQSATYTTPKPSTVQRVCIEFTQENPGPIVLSFYTNTTDYNPDPKKAKPPLRQYEKKAGKNGSFCVGRAWVEKTTFPVICNTYDTRGLGPADREELLRTGVFRIHMVRD